MTSSTKSVRLVLDTYNAGSGSAAIPLVTATGGALLRPWRALSPWVAQAWTTGSAFSPIEIRASLGAKSCAV
jgi:hypothetical protein